MLTAQDRQWHQRYEEELSFNAKHIIDTAARAMRDILLNAGEPAAHDDRAEALVAAITRFVIESRE